MDSWSWGSDSCREREQEVGLLVKELRRRAQNGWKRVCRMYSLSNVGHVQNLEGPSCGNRELADRVYYYLEEIFLAERGSHTDLS